MRRVALVVMTGWVTLVSSNANAGGCGPTVPGYVTPSSCWSAAPVVPVYPPPMPATVECETEDLVNQGQFYSTVPLIIRRTCAVRCPLPAVVEPAPVIPTCWR